MIEGSSFEVVPSLANQATSASGLDVSMEETPIKRANSSPMILERPIQLAGTLVTFESLLGHFGVDPPESLLSHFQVSRNYWRFKRF